MLGILSELDIKEVLQNNRLGRIGCTDDDEILIIPVTYFFEGNAVVCHSFEGKKLALMRRYPDVCFEVEEITDHQNWKCILAQGIFEELTNKDEIGVARNQLSEMALKKKSSLTALPPSESFERYPPPQGESIFYKIHLKKLTGRFEKRITG